MARNLTQATCDTCAWTSPYGESWRNNNRAWAHEEHYPGHRTTLKAVA